MKKGLKLKGKLIMNKIKAFWVWLVAIVGAVIGFLIYYLTLKNKEVNALKARVSLVETEKEADAVEADIKELKNSKKRLKKEEVEIDKVIEEVKEKRKQIKQEVEQMTPKELADYWNKL